MKKIVIRKRIKDTSKTAKKIIDISEKAPKVDIDVMIDVIKPDEVCEFGGRMDTGVRLYRGDFKISAKAAKRIDDAAAKAKEERKKEPKDFIQCPSCGCIEELYFNKPIQDGDEIEIQCVECKKYFKIFVKIFYKYICEK